MLNVTNIGFGKIHLENLEQKRRKSQDCFIVKVFFQIINSKALQRTQKLKRSFIINATLYRIMTKKPQELHSQKQDLKKLILFRSL